MITALKGFILEQLDVVKKSVEDLKDQQHAPENSPLFESLKEEIFYLSRKHILKQWFYRKTSVTNIKHKIRANKKSTKPDKSPENDEDTKMTQNN